jgi:high-affinity Fe2+/Pb2+ permease
MTIASLLVAVLFSSGVFAKDEVHDQQCEMYTNANSTSASKTDIQLRAVHSSVSWFRG